MAGLDAIRTRGDSSGIIINESAAFKAEVQFEKKDMARTTGYSSHGFMFDRIFCGKSEGIESDPPE